MTRKIIWLLCVSVAFLGCNSSSHDDIDKSVPVIQEGNTAFPTAGSTDTTDTGALQQAPTEAYTAANLNPPHGEPGHDCSIAVGAPLNGPVNTPGTVPANPQETRRINPPHGQPGHVCEVPVGQPLP